MREPTEEERQSVKDYIDKIKIDPLENLKKENEELKKKMEELKKRMREILLKIFKIVNKAHQETLGSRGCCGCGVEYIIKCVLYKIL